VTTNAPTSAPTASNITTNSVTLNTINAPLGWTTEYRLGSMSVWGGWQTSNIFTELTPATDYRFEARFRANNTTTHANSAASSVRVIRTAALPRLTTAAPRLAPTASNITTNSITLNTISAPLGWTTEYRRSLGLMGVWGGWQTSNIFTGLTPATGYQFQARFAANDIATHANSAEGPTSVTITTSQAINRPSLTLSRGTTTSHSVTLTGTITNTGGAPISQRGFWLRRESGDTTLQEEWVSTTSNTFSHTFTDLDPNTTYVVRAIARNTIHYDVGRSDPPITFTTLHATTTAPRPPTVRSTTADSIVVNPITPLSGWTTQYRIRALPNGYWSHWRPSYVFTNLTASTGYQVQAYFRADNPNTHQSSAISTTSQTIMTATVPTVPIIVIPGIAGSQLVDSIGHVIWVNLLEDTTLLRMDIFGNSMFDIRARTDEYGVINIYRNLVQRLRAEFGHNNVHFWPYDWRLCNARNANNLSDFITSIGSPPQVDIVAHSMGGLVAARYIANSNSNRNRIRNFITVGTPYLGAPEVPYIFATGNFLPLDIDNNSLRRVSSHMQSLYQLLPYNNRYPYIGVHEERVAGWWWNHVPDDHEFVINTLPMIDHNNNTVPSNVRRNFINRSVEFMETIHPNGVPIINSINSTNLHIIAGVGQYTITTTVFDSSGRVVVDFDFTTQGDGTVPLWSANIDGRVTTRNFGYNHTQLIQRDSVIRYIINRINGVVSPRSMSDYDYGRPFTVIRVDGPADVTITHNGETLTNAATEINTRTDFGSLYIIGENDDIKIFALDTAEIYDIIIEGTGEGYIDFDIRFFDASDELIEERSFRDVSVTDITHITTNTDQYEMTTLLIDDNGNGVYNRIIYPARIRGGELSDVVINVPDLEYNGLFTFDTIVLLGDNSSETTVFVEINKHSIASITTEPIRPIIINRSGFGIYTYVPSSVSNFAPNEHIEILVYADSHRQNLIARQFIRPARFAF